MVVDARSSPGLAFGAPVALPIQGTIHQFSQRNYDVTPDGKQLLVVFPASADDTRSTRIWVVQHWFDELRRLVPTD